MSTAQTEIANGFAREYYMLLNKDVNALVKLYTSDATLSHSEEGQADNVEVSQGKEQILAALNRDGFAGSKVVITDITAIPSHNQVLAVIIGDMKSKDNDPKTFTQTFILDKKKNGSYALVSDVLKFIRSEGIVAVSGSNTPVAEETKIFESNSSSSAESLSSNLVSSSSAESRASSRASSVSESAPKSETPRPNSNPNPSPPIKPLPRAETTSKSQTSEPTKPKFKFDRQSVEKASAFQPPKLTTTPMPAASPVMASNQYIRMAAPPYYPDTSYHYGYPTPAARNIPMYFPSQGNQNFNMVMNYGSSGTQHHHHPNSNSRTHVQPNQVKK